jgi:hypothetical protein
MNSLFLCWLVGVALAVSGGPSALNGPKRAVPTLATHIDGLDSPSRPRRVFAARELARQVRLTLRAANGPAQALSTASALDELAQMDERLAPACMRVLGDPAVSRPCTRILGRLETASACPQLAQQPGRLARRAMRRIGCPEAGSP